MSRLTIILFFLIVFIFDLGAYLPYHTPKNYFFILFIPLLASVIFVKGFIKKEELIINISFLELILILRFLWAVITNPAQILHSSSLGIWLLLSLTFLTIFVHQFSIEKKEYLQIYFIRALWIMGLIQAFIGFYQLCYYADFISPLIKTPMIGTIGSANGYGLFLALSIIALYFDSKSFKNKSLLIFSHIFVLVILSALILNQSRGALFSLFLVSLFYIILQFFSKSSNSELSVHLKKLLLPVILSSILLISVVFYMVYRINPESSSGRIMVWELSLPMLTDNPLTGVGYNRYSVEYLNYQARYFNNTENMAKAYKAANLKQAHNEYLQSFCEAGLIGGILFILIWFYALFSFFKELKRNKLNNKKLSSQITGFFLILAAILIHSCMDSLLHVMSVSFIAYYILGFLPSQKTFYKINLKSKRSIFIILLPLFILSVFILYKTIRQYPAYQEWQDGYTYNTQKHFSWAIPRYRSALKKLPGQGELHFHLGSALVLSGNYSHGLYYLQKSLINFNDRNIHLSMSYANLKLGQFIKAEKNALSALAMFPDHLAPHLLLGEIYFMMGNTIKSKSSLRKCMNSETTIISREVEQIKSDAASLWRKFYQ